MLLSKITLLLLGFIAAVSYGAVFPSLRISNNFAVTGTFGDMSLRRDANGNPTISSLSKVGFLGKAPIKI